MAALALASVASVVAMPTFNTSFAVHVNWSTGSPLPTYNFSVRQLNAVVWPPDGRTYAFADIIPFWDPYYPASYSSAIGVFSSPNGHSSWHYHGLVLKAEPGSWAAGGVATPGTAVAKRGDSYVVLISYTAESEAGGKGGRGIGLLSASHPLGPFQEMPSPALGLYGTCQSDDSQLLVRETASSRVDLFHRLRRNGVNGSTGCGIDHLDCSVGDCVVHRVSTDGGISWGAAQTARHWTPGGWVRGVWPLQELLDLKQVGNRLVRINDNWSAQTPCAGRCLLVYLSSASASGGNEWWPAEPQTLQGSLLAPHSGAPDDLAPDAITPQLAFIPSGATGAIAHVSLARFTNRSVPGGGMPPEGKPKPFTHYVYQVTWFG